MGTPSDRPDAGGPAGPVVLGGQLGGDPVAQGGLLLGAAHPGKPLRRHPHPRRGQPRVERGERRVQPAFRRRRLPGGGAWRQAQAVVVPGVAQRPVGDAQLLAGLVDADLGSAPPRPLGQFAVVVGTRACWPALEGARLPELVVVEGAPQRRWASGLAGVLNATTPLFTLAFAVAIRSERLSAVRLTGLLLGFAGVVVLAAPQQTAALGCPLPGVGACLLGAACYALSYVYARRFLTGRGLSALVLSTGQLAAGASLLALVGPVVARDPMSLTPTVITSVLVLGVLGTGVAYALNYQLIADEGAVAASTVTYLIPVVAVVLGALILNEPLTWNLLVGAVIVLVGVAVAEGRFGKVRDQPVLLEESERERTG